MRKEVQIDVTREDIENGTPGGRTCGINLALRRYMRLDGHELGVGFGDISVDSLAVGKIPNDAIQWAAKFDDGCEVKPFTFTALIDERWLLGACA